jgi:hypothetical protein
MSFSPDDIATREFFEAPDGFDRAEVRAYLRTVANQQRELQARIEELEGREESSDVGNDINRVLQSARLAAEQLLKKAESEAADLRHRAERESQMLRSATESATEKLRTEAEIYAGKVRAAIEHEAGQRLSHLARRADRVLAGEARIRERLFSLETTLGTLRGELQADSEALYPALPDPLAAINEMPAARKPAAIEAEAASHQTQATLRDADPPAEIVINLNGKGVERK